MAAIDPFIYGFDQQQKKPSIRTLGAFAFKARIPKKRSSGRIPSIKSEAFKAGRRFTILGLACRGKGMSLCKRALLVFVAIFSFCRSLIAVKSTALSENLKRTRCYP